MKIKLAILERDIAYLNRITAVFSTRYADKLEIYSFTEYEGAMQALDGSRIDVFLADDFFEVELDRLPGRCGFAYLIDNSGVEMVKDCAAVCRFQKADLIYKQILNIYSEQAESMAGFEMNHGDCSCIAFLSPAGGVGCSTMAAACARHFALRGKRVLYLNLERFGTSDLFFQGEGQFSMSDIIYALKGKRSNLAMKLESCVKQDACGVKFFSDVNIALDIQELELDEILRLLRTVCQSGLYEYIILDMDFSIDQKFFEIQKIIEKMVLVSSGSVMANQKVMKALHALAEAERSMELPILNRMVLCYNRFGSKTGRMLEQIPVRNIGGAPVYAQATERQIVEQLSELGIYDVL